MFLILAAAHAAPTHSSMEAATWAALSTRTHDDAGEIKVFRATVDGMECFRATAITASADGKTMLGVVSDVASATRWSSAGVTKAKLLGRSGNTISYYQYLDVPGWTMSSDRFWFLTSNISESGNTRSLKWQKLDPNGQYAAEYKAFVAENTGAVEPPVNVGSWTFVDGDFGAEINYMICTDAGGSIPSALQSAATKKTLPDTVGDVVREAKKRLGKQ